LYILEEVFLTVTEPAPLRH